MIFRLGMKKSSTGIVIGVIVVLVLAAVGYFFMNSDARLAPQSVEIVGSGDGITPNAAATHEIVCKCTCSTSGQGSWDGVHQIFAGRCGGGVNQAQNGDFCEDTRGDSGKLINCRTVTQSIEN